MNKQQIAAAILETEKTLANLRAKLNQSKQLTSFKTGDVFNCKGNVPIIVAEIHNDAGNKYHIIGNDQSNENFMRPYNDCKDGVGKKEMLDYLNDRIENDWLYVGNLSEKFDSIVREMIGE